MVICAQINVPHIMWVRILEVWLTARLLQSPTFHRVVQNLQRQMRRMTHGKGPEETGGTSIEKSNDSNAKGFLDHFLEEIREQFRGGPPSKK